jgi:tetratricopeptide (TPR) repeat protein
MRVCDRSTLIVSAAWLLCGATLLAQPPKGQPQPEFVRQGQQLMRQGKMDEALALYRQELEKTPDSLPAENAIGTLLDVMGRGAEARQHFAKAIDLAPTPQAKAMAQRAMAMSYAFEGDCANTVKYEQQVFDYYVSTNDAYQQGEIADEAARVCIDSGDLDAALKWYQIGHDAGLKEPDIKPDRVALWNYRLEHALARIAARRGNKAEAQEHVAKAKAALDGSPEMARAQAVFFPYLTGYVAFYTGDYKTALDELQKANQNDAFIQTLMGETYEKLGDRDKAMELYRRASTAMAHNPPAAYAHRITRQKLGAQ